MWCKVMLGFTPTVSVGCGTARGQLAACNNNTHTCAAAVDNNNGVKRLTTELFGWSSSFRGGAVQVCRRTQTTHKRAWPTTTTTCAMVNKEESNESKSKSKTEEEEEPLDEAAMRAAEIHEVLSGLKDFKSRIIDDATKLAKKVRAPKKQLEAALAAHPDIVKIDGHIAELEEELKVLGDR